MKGIQLCIMTRMLSVLFFLSTFNLNSRAVELSDTWKQWIADCSTNDLQNALGNIMDLTAVWKRMDFSGSSYFWDSVYKNQESPIAYPDNPSIFYGSKLVHTTCLYLIHAYIQNKMHFNDTSEQSSEIQQLGLYLLSIINSINTQEIDEMYIIHERQKLLS